VYSAQQVELGWFGEGDDFFFIDGAERPQLRGTGTEDYFNDAWGFREFSTPFYGVSLYEGAFPGDRVTAYRWHIVDPISFKKSLRVTIEHKGSVYDEMAGPDKFGMGGSDERPDWVSSVAFWYQYPPATIDTPLPPADKRIAPYRVIPVGKLPVRAEPEGTVEPTVVGVQFLPKTAQAAIEFDVTVDKPGRYQIAGMFEDIIMGAVFQPYLDGKRIGAPIDMVVPASERVWHSLDMHDLEAGKHTLRFEKLDTRSPNARSIPFTFTSFTLEYLTLLRLEDMDGYHKLYNEKKKNQ
jgi:hypothetical protein